ncbi:hypothetical protein [Sagittula stellata]|uniref:hypothetical protein n=2 Tax=Sagittula stellata TaxID=52603 RepID=UPI0012F4F1F3
MPSMFSISAFAPGASVAPRPVSEVDGTPASQSRTAPGGTSFGTAPQGAGAPVATGATVRPSAVQPVPATPPPVSTSQAARLAEVTIELQAEQKAEDAASKAAETESADAEAVRESAVPRGTDQTTLARLDTREDLRGKDEVSRSIAGGAVDTDPAREAADKYRDANETTSAAEPARLLMDA